MPQHVYTPEELEAIRKVVGTREKSIRRTLIGKELVISPSHAAKWAKAIKDSCTEARAAYAQAKLDGQAVLEEAAQAAVAPGVAAASKAARIDEIKAVIVEFFFESAPVAEVAQLIGATGLDTVASTLMDIVPYAGPAWNYISFLKEGGTAASKAFHLYQVHDSKSNFRDGDPKAAVEALEKYIAIELAFAAASSVEEYAVYNAKLAGVLLDLGTVTSMAIGAGGAAFKILKTLAWAAIEFRWFWRGRKALIAAHEHYAAAKEAKRLFGMKGTGASDEFNASLFSKCPILACYYLTLATHSDLVAFVTHDIAAGAEGPESYIDLDAKKKASILTSWLTDSNFYHTFLKGDAFANQVERSISGMLATRQKAAKVIGKSRFQLNLSAGGGITGKIIDELEVHPFQNFHRAVFDTLTDADRVVITVRHGGKFGGSLLHLGRNELNLEWMTADKAHDNHGMPHTPESMSVPTPGLHIPVPVLDAQSGLSTVNPAQATTKAKKAFYKFLGKKTAGAAQGADELFAVHVMHNLKKLRQRAAREMELPRSV